MTCARCRQDNRADARFCEHCGASLHLACTACDAELSPSARFCPECGRPTGWGPSPTETAARAPQAYTPPHLAERILISRAALEGERKQVTVLFADLKSSMELLADRDPEEAQGVLDPVLELMMEAVHHYEGTVNQVMGDGIMALFGAPLAYEDHALRACFAALRMQDRVRRHAEAIRDSLGLVIQIRIGLNSGEVVVRSVGSDLRMDYTAVGQTTHLAARMEQLAEPGFILATAHTVRLVEGSVQATSQGRVAVRGLETAVEVYTIADSGTVRSPLAAAVSRGLTRLVGRQAELAQLAVAGQSAARGHGQVVGLVGDPGVGKSRLFHECTRADRLPGWLVLRAGAVSYGRGTAYGPVVDLLRTYFKAEERDEPRDVGERIMVKLLDLELDVALAPTLFALLDVPIEDQQWLSLDPRQRRRQTMDALWRLLLRESQVQPLCILLEDLHWIDSETQEFLDSLVESLPAARILLLVDYRPEYRHEWGSRKGYVQLRIDPLTPWGAQELLRGLLGDDDALVPLKRLLVERTEGNPFFLEESVRTLVEIGALEGERGAYRLARPVEAIRVPPTVQAVLAARIDRLAPEDKRILQTAAVIGESVPVQLLQAVTEIPEPQILDALARLRAAEFLHDTSLFAEPVSRLPTRADLSRGLPLVVAGAPARAARADRGGHGARLCGTARRAYRAAGLSRPSGRAVGAGGPLSAAGGREGVRALSEPRGRGVVRAGARGAGPTSRWTGDQGRGPGRASGPAQRPDVARRARADPRPPASGAGARRAPRRPWAAWARAVLRGQLPVPPRPARASHRLRPASARGGGGAR